MISLFLFFAVSSFFSLVAVLSLSYFQPFLLHDESRKENNEQRVCGEGAQTEMAVGHDHEPEENDRYEGVDGDVLQWIVDGVVFLSHEIGDDHCCAITRKSCPGARHVAVARHEDKVHGN